jgi:hypothetical protein
MFAKTSVHRELTFCGLVTLRTCVTHASGVMTVPDGGSIINWNVCWNIWKFSMQTQRTNNRSVGSVLRSTEKGNPLSPVLWNLLHKNPYFKVPLGGRNSSLFFCVRVLPLHHSKNATWQTSRKFLSLWLTLGTAAWNRNSDIGRLVLLRALILIDVVFGTLGYGFKVNVILRPFLS